jgi:hypothetical protein
MAREARSGAHATITRQPPNSSDFCSQQKSGTPRPLLALADLALI